MSMGTISSSPETVGVGVINYPVPIVENKQEVLKNANKIASYVDGLKFGWPGLDIICFPEYSLQGLHPKFWRDLTTTVPGPETDVFAEACKRDKVWGCFSITGEENYEDPKRNPFNTQIIMNDRGQIVLKYHKINPWVPMEPWYPGSKTEVCEGPKGLKLGVAICYDANIPEIVRDTVMKGAELIFRPQGYMHPANYQQQLIARVRAWENLTAFAVANMAGRDLVYSYFGASCIVNFDGHVLAECGPTPEEAEFALISPSQIRDARRNWTAENHLFNIVNRGYTAVKGGVAECPYEFYRTWVKDPEKARETAQRITRPSPIP